MNKTILLTGATDGIGLEAAKLLAAQGHTLLVHGRNPAKLDALVAALADLPDSGVIQAYRADLSSLADVEALATAVLADHDRIDVLLNNAGVYRAPDTSTSSGVDLRFVVNTLAPYVLTKRLLSVIPSTGRVINLSSAAQRPVDLAALAGKRTLDDMGAYAQSKLAITMWSKHLADVLGEAGPIVVCVNPGSLLATKMVKEGFGVEGSDVGIGAEILSRAALSDEFADASGKYYDNDARRFGPPHADALDAKKNAALVEVVEALTSAST